MGIGINPGFNYKALTASGLVKTGAGVIGGFLVTASSSLTLKAWDNTSAATTVIFDTTGTVSANTYIPCPAAFSTGLYVTVGGTGSVTVLYL